MDQYSSAASSELSISSTTSLSSRTSSLSSFALPETGISKPEKPLQVLKVLLDILHKNGIPGPNLIRLETEFNLVAGEGGEGKVFGASTDFQQKLASISVKSQKRRLVKSAKFWQNSVIKRLRSDGSRGLAFQVNSAHTEIKLLSKASLRSHPNVVKLLGWALCLDSMENSASNIPLLPLLILEKANHDLRSFLISSEYNHTSYMNLCKICLGIGQGLEALHQENITHGDMKPANILIVDQHASKPNTEAVSCRWLPKLCDFGLAINFENNGDHSNQQRYQGTGGWKPPECYLDSPPASLQLCDIFAYGLVTWCVFIGNPSSPISTKLNQDEESAIIREQLGEQRNYQTASRSICTAYGILRSDVHLMLAELTDRAVDFPSGMNEIESSSRRKRKAFLREPRHVRAEQINHVLTLLRDSLNDDPKRRNHRPWEYMDLSKHEIVPPVQDPVKYSTKLDPTIRRSPVTSWNDSIFRNSHKLLLILQYLKHDFRQAMRQTTRVLRALTVQWVPWIVPQDPWQQAYNEMFFEIELSLRDKQAQYDDRNHSIIFSFEPNGIGLFAHERNHKCHNLDRLYDQIYHAVGVMASDTGIKFDNFRGLSIIDIGIIRRPLRGHVQLENQCIRLLYSFARLRSRVRSCCWQEHCRKPPLYSDYDSAMDVSSFQVGAMMEEKSMLVLLSTFGFDTLAWMCRGEIAAKVLKELEHEPERLWNWLTADYFGAAEKTARMTLFLERGCDIGQELHSDGSSRSVFQRYLEAMPSGELPIAVCRHFRRIATREGATPRDLFYLTGQSPDWSDDEPMNEKDLANTALHDAVRAYNYSVVEYLVRTNFTVSVEDVNGKTALALAEELGHDVTKAEDKKYHIQNNQIIALLRQTRSPVRRTLNHSLPPSNRKLPVGWEATELDANLTAYRETSIDSEADSLTFSEPTEGLLENKLALGQRKVTGQGQAYYLDPLRFLHTRLKGSEQARSATEATYGEEWYQRKAREVKTSPPDPRADRWLLYKAMARAYYILQYVATWIITPIGYLASNLYLVAMVLLFSLVAYDAWASTKPLNSSIMDVKN